MKGRLSIKVLSVVFLFVSFLGIGFSVSPRDQIEVNMTDPARDGIQVGNKMAVKGTANIPGGGHLWVLAHRIVGYEEVWWPQNEARIDSVTRNWMVNVVFGGAQDVGYDFGIAAIVVNEQEHIKLRNYRNEAMRTGHWYPIPMPPTVAAPVIRTVKKVSDN